MVEDVTDSDDDGEDGGEAGRDQVDGGDDGESLVSRVVGEMVPSSEKEVTHEISASASDGAATATAGEAATEARNDFVSAKKGANGEMLVAATNLVPAEEEDSLLSFVENAIPFRPERNGLGTSFGQDVAPPHRKRHSEELRRFSHTFVDVPLMNDDRNPIASNTTEDVEAGDVLDSSATVTTAESTHLDDERNGVVRGNGGNAVVVRCLEEDYGLKKDSQAGRNDLGDGFDTDDTASLHDRCDGHDGDEEFQKDIEKKKNRRKNKWKKGRNRVKKQGYDDCGIDEEDYGVAIYPGTVAYTEFDDEIGDKYQKKTAYAKFHPHSFVATSKPNKKKRACIFSLLFFIVAVPAVLLIYFLLLNESGVGDDTGTNLSTGRMDENSGMADTGVASGNNFKDKNTDGNAISGHDGQEQWGVENVKTSPPTISPAVSITVEPSVSPVMASLPNNDNVIFNSTINGNTDIKDENNQASLKTILPTVEITDPPTVSPLTSPLWDENAPCAPFSLELTTVKFGNRIQWEIVYIVPTVTATMPSNMTVSSVVDSVAVTYENETPEDGETNGNHGNFVEKNTKTTQTVVVATGGPYSYQEDFDPTHMEGSHHNATICLPEGTYEFIIYDSQWDSTHEYGLYFNGGRPVRPMSLGNFTEGLEITQFDVTLSDIITSSGAAPSLSTAPTAFAWPRPNVSVK